MAVLMKPQLYKLSQGHPLSQPKIAAFQVGAPAALFRAPIIRLTLLTGGILLNSWPFLAIRIFARIPMAAEFRATHAPAVDLFVLKVKENEFLLRIPPADGNDKHAERRKKKTQCSAAGKLAGQVATARPNENPY